MHRGENTGSGDRKREGEAVGGVESGEGKVLS